MYSFGIIEKYMYSFVIIEKETFAKNQQSCISFYKSKKRTNVQNKQHILYKITNQIIYELTFQTTPNTFDFLI